VTEMPALLHVKPLPAFASSPGDVAGLDDRRDSGLSLDSTEAAGSLFQGLVDILLAPRGLLLFERDLVVPHPSCWSDDKKRLVDEDRQRGLCSSLRGYWLVIFI
jgi:hypothetical protein